MSVSFGFSPLHYDCILQDGYTALMKACQYGREEVVGILLGANADVNIKNNVSTPFTPVKQIESVLTTL